MPQRAVASADQRQRTTVADCRSVDRGIAEVRAMLMTLLEDGPADALMMMGFWSSVREWLRVARPARAP